LYSSSAIFQQLSTQRVTLTDSEWFRCCLGYTSGVKRNIGESFFVRELSG
jgi:hypothetical protein